MTDVLVPVHDISDKIGVIMEHYREGTLGKINPRVNAPLVGILETTLPQSRMIHFVLERLHIVNRILAGRDVNGLCLVIREPISRSVSVFFSPLVIGDRVREAGMISNTTHQD